MYHQSWSKAINVCNCVELPHYYTTNAINTSCIVVKMISLLGKEGGVGGYSLPLVWQPTLSSHLTLQLVQRLQSGNGRLLGGFILPGLRVGARLRAVGVFSGGLPTVVFKLGGGVWGREQPSSQSGIPVSLLVSRVSPRRGWEKFHLRFSHLSRLKIIKLTLKICYNPL